MPAFTFEKISPPRHGAHAAHSQPPSQNTPPQPRDNVIQVLGRFVMARVREDQAAPDQQSPN